MFDHFPQKVIDLIRSNLTEKYTLESVQKNLSSFLIDICNFFEHPNLFKGLVFSIDDLEFFCTEETIKALELKNKDIPVKILTGSTTFLPIEEIQNSFKKGCVIDFLP